MFCNENLCFTRDHVDFHTVTSRLSRRPSNDAFVWDKLPSCFTFNSSDWFKTKKKLLRSRLGH